MPSAKSLLVNKYTTGIRTGVGIAGHKRLTMRTQKGQMKFIILDVIRRVKVRDEINGSTLYRVARVKENLLPDS